MGFIDVAITTEAGMHVCNGSHFLAQRLTNEHNGRFLLCVPWPDVEKVLSTRRVIIRAIDIVSDGATEYHAEVTGRSGQTLGDEVELMGTFVIHGALPEAGAPTT